MTVKILPTSEVRMRLAEVIEGLRSTGGPCLVTKNGRAVAAILSMETFERLMSDLEDRLDEGDASLAQDVAESRQQFKAGKTKKWTPPRP